MAKTLTNNSAHRSSSSTDQQHSGNTARQGWEWVISGVAVVCVGLLIAVAGSAASRSHDPMAGLSRPATQDTQRAEKSSPTPMKNQQTDAHNAQHAGENDAQQGHMGMVEHLRQRLNKNANDHEALFLLANTYMKIRDFDKAEPMYNRVVELDAKHLEARSNLALIAVQRENYQGGVNLLLENVREDPQHAETIYNLGFIYAKYLNEPAKTLVLWEQWMVDNPTHPLNERIKAGYEFLLHQVQSKADQR